MAARPTQAIRARSQDDVSTRKANSFKLSGGGGSDRVVTVTGGGGGDGGGDCVGNACRRW